MMTGDERPSLLAFLAGKHPLVPLTVLGAILESINEWIEAQDD